MLKIITLDSINYKHFDRARPKADPGLLPLQKMANLYSQNSEGYMLSFLDWG